MNIKLDLADKDTNNSRIKGNRSMANHSNMDKAEVDIPAMDSMILDIRNTLAAEVLDMEELVMRTVVVVVHLAMVVAVHLLMHMEEVAATAVGAIAANKVMTIEEVVMRLLVVMVSIIKRN